MNLVESVDKNIRRKYNLFVTRFNIFVTKGKKRKKNVRGIYDKQII